MSELIGICRAKKIMEKIEEIPKAKISKSTGIEGDARGRKRGRQVTILFEEDWLEACRDINYELHWTCRRANLFVRGIRGPQKEGSIVQIGDVELTIHSETDPCEVMENAHKGLRRALESGWRGGVCCSVLKEGNISIGDKVSILDN